MKCIVIDKDQQALSQLSAYVENDPSLKLLKKFDNTEEAMAFLQNGKCEAEAIFVEADMPGISGINLVKSLMSPMAVVITSQSTDNAYEAMKAGATDYLLKPYSFNDFKDAVAKAQTVVNSNKEAALRQSRSAKFVNNSRYIFIKSEYKVMRIDLNKIKFVESMREYVRFHIEDSRPIMSLLTIKAVENYLPSDMFMRVHRSYIVNLDKINVIERARIVFDGDTFIPVSEQYKEKFLSFLDQSFAQ